MRLIVGRLWAHGITFVKRQLSSGGTDPRQSPEGETLKTIQRLCQKCEQGGKPHKFSLPNGSYNALLVDMRNHLNGGDVYELKAFTHKVLPETKGQPGNDMIRSERDPTTVPLIEGNLGNLCFVPVGNNVGELWEFEPVVSVQRLKPAMNGIPEGYLRKLKGNIEFLAKTGIPDIQPKCMKSITFCRR